MTDGIYLDNASTSFPKPEILADVVAAYLREAGCSPGRSGHRRGRDSEALVDQARRRVAGFLGCADPSRIAYTYNATYALNMAIKGVLRPGDHAIVTCLEHNSVLRPLDRLRRQGVVDYTVTGLGPDGLLDLDQFRSAFRTNTRLVVVTHASNVTGVVTPVERLTQIAHDHDARLLVDLSQTAGILDVDLDAWGVDLAAFTGHKSLLGLPGIGGLYIAESSRLNTVIEGGTGGNSIELQQPSQMPTKLEPGTCNYTGIVALGASVAQLQAAGLETIRNHELELLARATAALREADGVTLYGDVPLTHKIPVLSFTVADTAPETVGTELDARFGIMTRTGLHCAPLAHAALGTSPQGTVRVSFGAANTRNDVDLFLEAVEKIAADRA